MSITRDGSLTPTVGSNSKRVGEAENGRGGADAERERDDGRQRENGAASKQPDGVTQVGRKGHGSLDSSSAGFVSWLFRNGNDLANEPQAQHAERVFTAIS